MLCDLNIELLSREASAFANIESSHSEPTLYGVTDGKTIGTYFERKFQAYLKERYAFEEGSSARGIDFPGLGVDIKVTSVIQPQSSSPYRNARQKIYGLGYSLLIFVYEKSDATDSMTGSLDILHSILVDSDRIADYQTTSGVRRIIDNNGNLDDIFAFLQERRIPADESECMRIAEDILANPPKIGYLTISNALQWRLQYRRAIEQAGAVRGLHRIR